MSLSENCARIDVARSRSRRKRGLPQDPLEVVVAVFESVTEPVGHRHLVGRLTIALAHLDAELPGRQGADAYVCHGLDLSS
jgi:hypothetical protein